MYSSSKTLIIQKALIDGQWREAESGEKINVHNPYDGSVIGTVPKMGTHETQQAINSAAVAFKSWSIKTGKERAEILKRWYSLIEENSESLARLLTLEQGKPLDEARGELRYALSFVEWFAEEAKRLYGDVLPTPNSEQRLLAIKQPIGVCGAIIAWNFPSALVTRKIAPALAAGCTVVLKPSELTPFTALALGKLALDAGLPAGVFNIVTGSPVEIGGELTGNPKVRKITFTGSTDIGRLLMEQSASSIKKMSLELGGNAPFIIFDDADPEKAVSGLLASKFRNAGQTCICANRVYVQKGILDNIVTLLAERVKDLKVGNGFDPSVDIGPLINEQAIKKVDFLVNDAIAKGAKVIVGGGSNSSGSLLYSPTVLGGVSSDMAISREEIFGPVIALTSFSSEEEALEMANNTDYGLAAYFYTEDRHRIWRLMEQLEFGVVGVNTGVVSNEVGPFGGIKQSGIGREGSKYGIDEFLELKYACIQADFY